MAMELFQHPRRCHFLLFLILLTLPSCAQPFVVPLRHRDSPSSPFFDTAATEAGRWRSVHRRSLAHRGLAAGFDAVGGEYYMTLKIGNPSPMPLIGWLDVAGMIVATPCGDWGKGRPGDHYDPGNSTTKQTVPCDDPECAMVLSECHAPGEDACTFDLNLGAWTQGTLMRDYSEIATDGGVLAVEMLSFGCVDSDAVGTATASTRVGIMGSDDALLQQVGNDLKFAHCFARGPNNTAGHLSFGASVEMSGLAMSLTKCTDQSYQVFYSPPPLKDIIVGSQKLNLSASELGNATSCNMLFDSLQPLTLLPRPAFDLLAAAVKEQSNLRNGSAAAGEPWYVCFLGTEQDIAQSLPSVTLQLGTGIGIELPKVNTYAQVDGSRVCMLVAPADDQRTVIGTLALQDVYVSYDLKDMLMALNPKPCA